MELVLNILWLLIAFGALGVWQIFWKRQERGSHPSQLEEWTAFTCALVFVFFAVSLSDDLHADVILADDCASGRHHALISACGHGSHQPTLKHPVSTPAPSRLNLPPLVAATKEITRPAVRVRPASDLHSSIVRAPPVSFL